MPGIIRHSKVSAISDDADTGLIRPSDWNADHLLAGGTNGQFLQRQSGQSDGGLWAWVEDHYVTLTNQSGVTLNAGDVAIHDAANNSAVVRTTTVGSTASVVIAAESINNGASGRFRQTGLATVAVAAAVTRGDNLRTSATAGQAESAGANPTDGSFARAMTGSGGAGTVTALLYGSTSQVRQVSVGHVRGLRVDRTGATTADITADGVLTYNPSSNNKSLAFHNPGTETLNISNQGVNGRDQAGAFSANSFIHLYYIGRDDTGVLDTVASAAAPPTGPDLASLAGLQPYDFWIYIGGWRLDGSGNLMVGRLRGSNFWYEPENNVLDEGTATTETAVSLATYVPSNALEAHLHVNAAGSTGSQATALILRVTTTVNLITLQVRTATTLERDVTVPNVGQNVYYLRQTALATDIFVRGYKVPNGAE